MRLVIMSAHGLSSDFRKQYNFFMALFPEAREAYQKRFRELAEELELHRRAKKMKELFEKIKKLYRAEKISERHETPYNTALVELLLAFRLRLKQFY